MLVFVRCTGKKLGEVGLFLSVVLELQPQAHFESDGTSNIRKVTHYRD